jgi:PAS domain S-box-containing protein
MDEQKIETARQQSEKRDQSLSENIIDGYVNKKEKNFAPFAYRLKKLSLLFSILIVLIGILVLIGWAANISLLKNFSSSWISMKVNTALCFLFAGFTLILVNGNKIEGRRKIWSLIFSLIIFCIATATLLEYIFHFNAGIDELFFKDTLTLEGTNSPGRPSIPTAICFFLIGIALFLISVKKITIIGFQGINLAVGLVALLSLLGYAFGAEEFTSGTTNTAVAIHTSMGFLLFVLASLFLLPQFGIMKLVSSNTSGGRLIRKSFPLIILTIIITGWLSMEESWATFYDVYFGMTVYIIIVIIVFTITIFINAYSLIRSENKINKEKEFSNYLLDSIPGIFYLIDDTGRLHKWNKNFEPETGYTTKEIAGMNILDFFDGEDRIFISGKIQEAFANGESSGETNLKSKTNQLTAHYFTIKKIVLEGNVLLLGTALNITARKIAEQERELYYKFFNATQDIMVVADPLGCFKKVNPACLQLLGYSEEELIKKPFVDFIYKEDKQKTIDEMTQQMQLGYSINFENRYACKNGTLLWLSWSAQYSAEEEITYATARDITEAKLMEDKLKQASLYNRSLIEASLDPLVTISPEGKITDVNNATVKVTGVERTKLIGTDFSNYFTEPDKAKQGYQQVLKEGLVTDYFLIIRHKNGKLTEVLYNASVYKDVSGKIIGVFAAARDVTAQKKAEAELHKLNTTLEEKVKDRTSQYETVNKELESFTYSVSHDLRSPLRAINSYSQILNEDYTNNLDDNGKQILENIKYNTAKMGKLIDELLAFSRLGRKQLERTEIDMNVLVNEVLNELNKSAEHHAEIKLGQLPVVKADPTLMHQVMLNLISNAVKYSSKKEKPVVEIYAEEKNGKTVFAVKDNGAGFDMRFAGKLFGVFQRLHSEKEFEGNGVGLAIVKRIISKHDGEVWGTAEENKGAKFYFLLN